MEPPAARPAATPPLPMAAWRRRVVAAALGLFVLVSAAHAYTGREHWPFSPYAMYSTPKEDYQSDKLLLVSVEEDSRERWLLSPGDLAPLNRARVGASLERARRADRKAGLDVTGTAPPGGHLHAAFVELVELIGPHHPEARSFRLYHAVWDMDPAAANLRTPETWHRLAEAPAP